jgi:hypothetical protein
MKTRFAILLLLSSAALHGGCTYGPQKAPERPAQPESWNTYTDEQFHYRLKYPKEATLRKVEATDLDPNTLSLINISLWGPTQKKDTEFYDGLTLDVFVKKLNGASLEAKVQEELDSTKATGEIKEDKKPVTVAGRTGYQFTSTGLGTFTQIFLPFTNGTYVQFVYSYGGAKSADYSAMATAIVQSFKFSE